MSPLNYDELLFLKGKEGTLGIIKVGENNQFFLETEKCVLYMIREVGSPFIVLPKKHPASKRLKIVVSAGSRTRISCSITPGTHPEQDILCGADEFDCVEIRGVKGGVEFDNLIHGDFERIPFDI